MVSFQYVDSPSHLALRVESDRADELGATVVPIQSRSQSWTSTDSGVGRRSPASVSPRCVLIHTIMNQVQSKPHRDPDARFPIRCPSPCPLLVRVLGRGFRWTDPTVLTSRRLLDHVPEPRVQVSETLTYTPAELVSFA
jgi:hypothetical protein